MCKIAFINYFKGGPRDVLCRVYNLLEGFQITPQVLDVVSALVDFRCVKSLKNTMGNKRRSKMFKIQLSYLLVKLAKEASEAQTPPTPAT